MTSQARIEANRKNAQRSTGPRTEEGKSKVRFNALKDGATARSPVIPGEDAAQFQHRIDTWIKDLAPKSEVECYLAEHAARCSWQLDRLDRAHAARLAFNIRNAAHTASNTLHQQVASLGRLLFHDTRGPIQTYPHFEYKPHIYKGQTRVSWSGLPDDPDHPQSLLLELESTAPGCQWLLAQWSQLRRLLDHNLPWQSPDKLKAIRLLGHQPLDALDHPEIATIFLAAHALDPAQPDPFKELWTDLHAGEKDRYEPQLAARGFDTFDPAQPEMARDWLKTLITQQTQRLQSLAADHQARQQADESEEFDRLAFDDTPGGERLRRYHATCSRSMIRSLDLLRKARQSPPDTHETAAPPPQKNKAKPTAKPQADRPRPNGEREGVRGQTASSSPPSPSTNRTCADAQKYDSPPCKGGVGGGSSIAKAVPKAPILTTKLDVLCKGEVGGGSSIATADQIASILARKLHALTTVKRVEATGSTALSPPPIPANSNAMETPPNPCSKNLPTPSNSAPPSPDYGG